MRWLAVIEGRAGAREAARRHHQQPLLEQRHRPLGRFQRQGQDSLQTTDVEQVERQGPRAGGVQTRGGVALGEAEQLLGLAELGPGQRSRQQPLGEDADVVS